ncbi:MAG: O-antigen ligase family protein, partial [Chloroflexi bacterium]|nr:O-antigen ligase family protein [Chloroflexota bacterium]
LTFSTLAFVAFAAMLAALAMSWSRGAWLGVGAALVVTVIVQSRRAFIFSLVVVLIIAAIIFLSSLNIIPSILAERFEGIANYFGVFDVRGVKVDDANFAIVERMAHWQAAFEMFASSPWRGIGFGNYAIAYPRVALPHWSDPLGHAHNYFLNVAAEAGLAGALAYIILWGAAFWHGWRAVRATRGMNRALAAGLLGMVVGLTVHNSFDNLFVHAMQMQVGIGLGITAWLNQNATEKK